MVCVLVENGVSVWTGDGVTVITALEDPEATRLYVCTTLAVICDVNEACGVKEAVSTTLCVRAVDGLDVREADGMTVVDCGGDKDALKVVVGLEDNLGLADEDKTDSGEGVAVWQGELENDTDTEVVTDARGD